MAASTNVRGRSPIGARVAPDVPAGETPPWDPATAFPRMKELIAAGDHEQAIDDVLRWVPQMLASDLIRKEKFNHLAFMARLALSGGTTKHGYEKLRRKLQGLRGFLGGLELPESGGFLELGCGAHDPVSLAAAYFANGYEPCYAIDLLPPRHEVYTALSMYDCLANMHAMPERYLLQQDDATEFRERIQRFDLEAFERGDFWGGLEPVKDKVRFEAIDLLKSSVERESIRVLSSHAVLEHVPDLDAICAKLYDILMPGGVAYHFIDMADHRAYKRDGAYNPNTFLTEQVGPSGVNRFRATEQIAAQERAGFEVLKNRPKTVPVQAGFRARLAPRFAEMSDDDIATIRISIVVRKPGREI